MTVALAGKLVWLNCSRKKPPKSLIAQAQRQDKLHQWQTQQRQMELNSVQAQLDALVVKAPYSGRVRRVRWLEQVGGQVKVEIALQIFNE